MQMKLLQLEHRIRELESLAEEVADLAKKQGTAGTVEPNLKAKGNGGIVARAKF